MAVLFVELPSLVLVSVEVFCCVSVDVLSGTAGCLVPSSIASLRPLLFDFRFRFTLVLSLSFVFSFVLSFSFLARLVIFFLSLVLVLSTLDDNMGDLIGERIGDVTGVPAGDLMGDLVCERVGDLNGGMVSFMVVFDGVLFGVLDNFGSLAPWMARTFLVCFKSSESFDAFKSVTFFKSLLSFDSLVLLMSVKFIGSLGDWIESFDALDFRVDFAFFEIFASFLSLESIEFCGSYSKCSMICGSFSMPFLSALLSGPAMPIFAFALVFFSGIESSLSISPLDTASMTSSTLLCLDNLRFLGDLPLFNLLTWLLTELLNTGLVTLIGMSAVTGVNAVSPLTLSSAFEPDSTSFG